MQEEPILHYAVVGFPRSADIKLYEDGSVLINQGGLEGKTIAATVPPEQARSYVERMIRAGFLSLDDVYTPRDFVMDGSDEKITLNWNGASKTVECRNARPRSREFNQVIAEILGLVG